MNQTIIGRHIKCILRNSVVIEGVAEEWSDVRVVLRSLDGESLMIIHKPTDDILMTKVLLHSPTNDIPVETPEPPKTPVPSEMQEKIKEKLQETLQMTDDPELQKKSVEELRHLVHEQERQILAQKKREHFGVPGAAKMTQYSSPYMPRVHPRSNVARSAYQPGKLPSWAYGRPPKDK